MKNLRRPFPRDSGHPSLSPQCGTHDSDTQREPYERAGSRETRVSRSTQGPPRRGSSANTPRPPTRTAPFRTTMTCHRRHPLFRRNRLLRSPPRSRSPNASSRGSRLGAKTSTARSATSNAPRAGWTWWRPRARGERKRRAT